MQRVSVDGHQIEVHGHLGFSDLGADTSSMVLAADGIADGSEGA
jgi:hypothetical protein